MTVLRQLLLIPLLAPLLAVLLVGAINPRPAVSLRLLIWSSPALPLGAWLMLAAGGGGLLSALGTGLALRGAADPTLQRRVRRPAASSRGPEPWPAASPSGRSAPFSGGGAPGAGPSRAAGEPSPTVEVPFRVIRRGRPNAVPQEHRPATAAAATGTGGADDWDQPLSDDW